MKLQQQPFSLLTIALVFISQFACGQNSMIGDGFGGRLWYTPYNYTVGSYSAYTVCGEDRQLWGWGANLANQLGNPIGNYSIVPVKAIGMTNVKYYSTGYVMGAIKNDQTGWIWGFSEPQAIKVIDNVKFVDAGANSCAFVKEDGTVWSAGLNYLGEFGNGNTSQVFSTTPSQMKNISTAVRTAQGAFNTIVLLENGDVMTTGSNLFGGLGNGSPATTEALLPIQITALKEIIDIKANASGLIALDKYGDVWQWGLINTSNVANIIFTPSKVSQFSNIVAISGCNDGFHFMALDKDKNCYAWGDNSQGQCGDGSTIEIMNPKIVATDVIEIMAGEWFSYIIRSDGALMASGYAGVIWLDLPIQQRLNFTKLNPTLPDFSLCKPQIYTSYSSNLPPVIDSSQFPIPPAIFLPNVFSPNNDGRNDIFKAIIKEGAIIDKFSLQIFNRWGELVYKTNRITQGWDGFYKSKEAELGNYFYYVEYNQLNKRKQFLKGDVTLIR